MRLGDPGPTDENEDKLIINCNVKHKMYDLYERIFNKINQIKQEKLKTIVTVIQT